MKHTLRPIKIPSGSMIPVLVTYYLCEKYPIILIEIDNGDGTTVDAPNITATRVRDTDGYITSLIINDASDGTGHTTDNLIISIK